MIRVFHRQFLGVAAVAAVCTGCVDVVAVDGARYVERVERQFPVTGKPDLDLSTFDGSIRVRPWDRREVLVVVERRAATRSAAESIEIVAEQDGNRITLKVRHQPDRAFDWTFGGRSASLDVSVPASADLRVRSGDGSLDVEGIEGRVELRTGDGSIRGRQLAGDLRLATGDGSIRLSDASGTLTAQTGDGGVHVDGELSAVQVHTGDGLVRLAQLAPAVSPREWSISTGDGSVTLELPDGFGADLDAHTSDGRIAVEDLGVSNVTGRIGNNRLRGQLGSGGAPLKIRTGDGSITLRRR
jgi:hypothetical protein